MGVSRCFLGDHLASPHSPMDGEGVRAGAVGLPEVEVVPVHVTAGPAVGQCHLPQGGQRYQRGAEEEGGRHPPDAYLPQREGSPDLLAVELGTGEGGDARLTWAPRMVGSGKGSWDGLRWTHALPAQCIGWWLIGRFQCAASVSGGGKAVL